VEAGVEVQKLLFKSLGLRNVFSLPPLGAVFHSLDFNGGWEML
jgi:hypothetical protein